MSYCQVADLLLGAIPTPTYLNVQKYVDDAANEIDSYIGRLYTTPVTLSPTDPTQRPGYLTLLRINSHLATGRIILAVSSGTEDKQMNAYGLSLVTEALKALQEIASGEYLLPGATSLPGEIINTSAPKIANVDATSQVEDFYNKLTTQPAVPVFFDPLPRYGY